MMRRTGFAVRFGLAAVAAATLALSAANSVHAAEKLIDKIHFLIPGGAGGG